MSKHDDEPAWAGEVESLVAHTIDNCFLAEYRGRSEACGQELAGPALIELAASALAEAFFRCNATWAQKTWLRCWKAASALSFLIASIATMPKGGRTSVSLLTRLGGPVSVMVAQGSECCS